jgi:L,D-peptidoglycan transpeptidase YkuD (ErfK/YbiS/YcfS/YnhG family)
MGAWSVAPRKGFTIVTGAVAFAALLAPLGRAASAGATSLPTQVITVEAATARSETAVLRTWTLTPSGHYVQVFAPDTANVGVNGVRPTREGLGRTPVGVFTLTQAFGNQPNNGTRLPYTFVGPSDWWDEDPASPEYNRLVVSTVSPGGNSENLYYSGEAYAHAVVINYNVNPVVKGAGSGFFLHVSMGVATQGCVSIPLGDLDRVMRWLNPSTHPVISIGVGNAALTILQKES